jgi:hypothetical protein
MFSPTPIPQRLFLTSLLLALFALGGCTHTLYIDTDFPNPLIEKFPHTVGVYYSPEFKDYIYQEESKDRTKWVIESGPAQELLFDTMLEGMFTKVEHLESLPPWDATPQANIILAPTVEDFQYTLPRETKIKVYEIWIKYNVQVYTPDGALIADWILTSYGKTPTGFMQSDDGALHQAIVVSLRDAGANLVLNFAKVPEIRAWLVQNNVQYSQLPNGASP